MNNTLDELIERYTTLYGKKELVEMETLINKTYDGWRREEKMASAPEQTGKEHSINQHTQPK